VLLTSIDRDGTRSGYDLELTAAVAGTVKVPVIASGGAGNAQHIVDALTTGRASAALLASLLHFGIVQLPDLKAILASAGVPIRPPSPAPTPVELASWLA
jgi:imidazole glycerol-phosphate synthase subunit HisF